MKIAQIKFETLIDEGFIVEQEKESADSVYYLPDEDYIICVAEGIGLYNKQTLTGIRFHPDESKVDLHFVSEAGNDVCRTFHTCVYLELVIYKNIAEQ